MNIKEFKAYCMSNGLTLTRTTKNRRKRSNGTCYLVTNSEGDEVDFFEIYDDTLLNSKARIEERLATRGTTPQGEWSAIDPVKEFGDWIESLAVNQVRFPLEEALEITKALSRRDLASKASVLGFTSAFKDGKVYFSKREKTPSLSLNNLS